MLSKKITSNKFFLTTFIYETKRMILCDVIWLYCEHLCHRIFFQGVVWRAKLLVMVGIVLTEWKPRFILVFSFSQHCSELPQSQISAHFFFNFTNNIEWACFPQGKFLHTDFLGWVECERVNQTQGPICITQGLYLRTTHHSLKCDFR